MTTFIPHHVPDFPQVSEDICELANCSSCDYEDYDASIISTIDMDLDMYGNVKPFAMHLLIATSGRDWPHTIEDTPGVAKTITEALEDRKALLEAQNLQRIVLTNSSMETSSGPGTDLMLLGPRFIRLRSFMDESAAAMRLVDEFVLQTSMPTETDAMFYQQEKVQLQAIVLICSHSRRDKRCGKTAPILLEAFEDQLRQVRLAKNTTHSLRGICTTMRKKILLNVVRSVFMLFLTSGTSMCRSTK